MVTKQNNNNNNNKQTDVEVDEDVDGDATVEGLVALRLAQDGTEHQFASLGLQSVRTASQN